MCLQFRVKNMAATDSCALLLTLSGHYLGSHNTDRSGSLAKYKSRHCLTE